MWLDDSSFLEESSVVHYYTYFASKNEIWLSKYK